MYVCIFVCIQTHTCPYIFYVYSTLIYIIYYIDSTVNDFNEENLGTLLHFGDKGNYFCYCCMICRAFEKGFLYPVLCWCYIHTDEPQKRLQAALEEIQAELPGTTKPVHTWQERMEHREESWKRVRLTLLECVISTYGLGDSSVSSSCYQLLSSLLEHYCGILINQCCCRCDKKGFIRCHQCGLNQLLCGDCDIEVHNSLLRDREMWNNFCFQAIPPTTTCNDVGLPIMIGK